MSAPTVDFAVGKGVLGLGQGDITAWGATAVVNAANSGLAGGGGVDGAIHRAAGPGLPEACREIVARMGPLPPGEAVVTPGFALRARYIIHAVGPIWRGGGRGEALILARAYRSCLELCREHEVDCVVFPAISCGAYGYPVDQAATIALAELAGGLREGLVPRADMALFSAEALDTWLAIARRTL